MAFVTFQRLVHRKSSAAKQSGTAAALSVLQFLRQYTVQKFLLLRRRLALAQLNGMLAQDQLLAVSRNLGTPPARTWRASRPAPRSSRSSAAPASSLQCQRCWTARKRERADGGVVQVTPEIADFVLDVS
ncbi:hypothetical protein [Brevibacillus nitrificans]|uniref:hypothetical protein n=1 Tax=Brevibacillus nitrificans TaxID=651560 RepID=UPI00285D31BC|nr:hypothetical protein [Brevibacillus nitrificans]MDR7319537.1 hypothetical protein [Brevibacillus nitrificans]